MKNMPCLATLALCLFSAACASSPESTIQAPITDSAALALSGLSLDSIDWEDHVLQDPPHVRVLPLDGDGQQARTRVAVVRDSGSSSVTGKGPLVVRGSTSGPATLVLSTDRGQIAWRTIAQGESDPMAIAVDEQGAFLEVELTRDEDTRIAVFFEGTRLHDCTLRPGRRTTFIVPAGDVTFGLTGPDPTTQTKSFTKGQRRLFKLE